MSSRELEIVRRWFEAKLLAERELTDVQRKIEGRSDLRFLLLDARGRDAYAKGHLPGALCAPLEEVEEIAERLAPDLEYVAYCSGPT
jgi:rhodanese-related sulfurtransferase